MSVMDERDPERVAVLDVARDVAKALLVGLAAGAALGAVAFACGFAFGGAGVVSASEAAKDVLLFLAAVMLFLLAGMILIKGKKGERPLADKEGWQRHFRVVGPKSVLAGIAVGVTLVAIAADYLHYFSS